MNTPTFQNTLRAFVILLTIAGALGSLFYFLNASPKNDPMLTKGLTMALVLSPFIGLLLTDSLSEGRSESTRQKLYLLMILVSMISLTFYSGIMPLPDQGPTFYYKALPIISWIIITLGIVVYGKRTKRRKRKVNS